MLVLLFGFSYLLGSVTWAYLIPKWIKGIDIRKLGSRNPGAANVITQVGKGAGALVVLLDFGKGFFPVFLARSSNLPLWAAGVAGILAVAGHCWPVYMGFDGGGGMMTSMGVLVALAPFEFAVALSAAVVAGILARYLKIRGWFGSRINLGAVVGFIVFYFLLVYGHRPVLIVVLVTVLNLLLVLRQLQISRRRAQDP
jgi:glycerol-3-phosphate acyltransferase PlsY